MERRQFGNTDMRVSVLGFGGYEIAMKGEEKTVKEVEQLLSTALENGVNVIDTASSYNSSEALIGKSMSHRRNDYYLFSKLGEGTSVGLPYPDWDVRNVRPSIERSLKDLKTDYLDLILIHSCSEAVLRQGDLIEAVQRLKQEGLARYIGYSGDSTDALYAIQTNAFDALQTSLNLADQEAIDLTLDEAAKRSMGVIAKRPVTNVVWEREGAENAPDTYVKRMKKLDYPFSKADSDTLIEMSLRFVLTYPQVHTAIVGTADPEHLLENVLSVSKGKLSDGDLHLIRSRWKEAGEPAWAGLK
ncbi:aldo/keto reductase [Cohnella lupini]|uniref:Putative aldo/keto reductase-like oxidoreductase n=1 Tax=Cohnella lupini TaxID=1294267 RepID=A0A3D9HQG9_9BACL|nr:aldo/keto reductase [Cohnella lupini]RED51710.1 putative aldo/keto reductase-like oxidoreductase [Cohnella lupini]